MSFPRGKFQHAGVALIFVIGMLALLSVLGTSFVFLTSLESRLAANFTLATRARLAAESGVAFALQHLRGDAAAGPVDAAALRAWGYNYAEPESDAMLRPARRAAYPLPDRPEFHGLSFSGVMETQSGFLDGFSLQVADESGKLNLNDLNAPPLAETIADRMGYGSAYLEQYDVTLGRLGVILQCLAGAILRDPARGRDVAATLLFDATVGRQAHADDAFPDIAAVRRALAAARLTDLEIDRLLDCVTLDSWHDADVLRPNGRIYGRRVSRRLTGVTTTGESFSKTYDTIGVDFSGAEPGAGGLLTDALDLPVESNLAMQSRDFELEARAPVNLNTARFELLQALIQPLLGVFLEEGPAENQSCEHYGWWATGLGEPDGTVFTMGTLRLTRPFDAARARRLAWAIYCRVHGIANDDLEPEQQADNDGDGAPDPNPLETWEEFRHFLEEGLVNTPATPAADDILLGEDFDTDVPRHVPTGYPVVYVDPHAPWNPAHAGAEDQWYRTAYRELPARLCDHFGAGFTSWSLDGADAWLKRYYRQAQIDLLCANFNPNAQLNDFNPNANQVLMVDKGQLLFHSTEGGFAPTGVFSVASLGRVLGNDGATLAQAGIALRIRLFDTLRLTTQAQFLEGLEDAGEIADYFSSPAIPAAQRHRSPHHQAGGRFALQSYPEPLFPGAERAVMESTIDGSLLLATIEPARTTPSAWASFSGFTDTPLRLQQPADGGSGDPRNDPRNHLHAGAVMPPSGANAMPGSLYPDGAYSEKDRTLAYPLLSMLRNTSTFQVNLSFWLKPNFHTGMSTRIRKFFAGPTRRGRYARETLLPLYLMQNPASNEANGWPRVSGMPVNTARQFSVCAPTGVQAPHRGVQYGQANRNYWIPTRCLLFGFAWQTGVDRGMGFLEGSLVSRAVTRDYPLAGNLLPLTPGVDLPIDYPSIPGHQWTQINIQALLGNQSGAQPDVRDRKLLMTVNQASTGESGYAASVPSNNARGSIWNRYRGSYTGGATYPQTLMQSGDFEGEWFRFGELPGEPSGSPYYTDATIDEIDCYGTTTTGRYFNVTTDLRPGCPIAGYYTTPAVDISKRFTGAGKRTLRDAAWTLYRPRHNRMQGAPPTVGDAPEDNVMGVVVNPTDLPDPMARYWARDTQPVHDDWDPISIDFRRPMAEGGGPDPEWEWMFAPYAADTITKMPTYPGGSPLSSPYAPVYHRDSPFQCRVYFHIQDNQRLYESPALDDMTFTFWRDTPEVLVCENS